MTPGVQLNPDETLDDLRLGGLKIIQHRQGYRFSLDPILLCAFTSVKQGAEVVDLGTGSGVIPLVLARRSTAARILGVERQPELADRARRSVAFNGLEGRIRILEEDLRRIRHCLPAQSFDVVVTNPPYRRAGSGRIAPDDERAAARHELAGRLEDFLEAAAYLLREGGRCYLVHLAERLGEVVTLMGAARLEPKRLRCVHSRAGEEARLVLVEGRKEGRSGLTVEPPLVIYAGEGRSYSEELLAMYEGDRDEGNAKGGS